MGLNMASTGKMALIAAGLSTILCAGCYPDDLPAYVNDGKMIVTVAQGSKEQDSVWTYALATKTLKEYPIPDIPQDQGWHRMSARTFDGKVWIFFLGLRGLSDEPKKLDPRGATRCFNVGKHEFESVPSGSGLQAIPAYYKGKKCLYVNGENSYDVYSLDGIKKQGSVRADDLISAGDFWYVQAKIKERTDPEKSVEIERLELFDPNEKLACTIFNAECTKVLDDRPCAPSFAMISPDRKTLVLWWSTDSGGTAGLFDVKSGKLIWSVSLEDYRCVRSPPAIKGSEVWTIEREKQAAQDGGSSDKVPSVLALVRYRADKKESLKGSREVILSTGIEGRDIESFSPSPDGSTFVVQLEPDNKPARLLIVPIKEGVKAKDIQEIELKVDAKDAQSQPATAPASAPATSAAQ